MSNIILRSNATPVYGFLSRIAADGLPAAGEPRMKILDCGAGGPVPPVALFAQHGFEAFGIDIGAEQLMRAQQFCEDNAIDVDLREGDMRAMPFEDATFDYVFEQYAMCHLSKEDTAKAINDMYRVLKPGGMALLGVISMDCWPKTFFGEEKLPGEFWAEEHGELTRHSMFNDVEADVLVTGWKVLSRTKQINFLRDAALDTSLEDWMALRGGQDVKDWRASYDERANAFRYVHLYYTLQKA